MSLSNHVAEQSSFLQLRTEPRFNLIDHLIDHVGRILYVQKAISHLYEQNLNPSMLQTNRVPH